MKWILPCIINKKKQTLWHILWALWSWSRDPHTWVHWGEQMRLRLRMNTWTRLPHDPWLLEGTSVLFAIKHAAEVGMATWSHLVQTNPPEAETVPAPMLLSSTDPASHLCHSCLGFEVNEWLVLLVESSLSLGGRPWALVPGTGPMTCDFFFWAEDSRELSNMSCI